MHTVQVSKTIGLPADKLWAAMADYGGIYKFAPGVSHSEVLNDVVVGPGAQRICEFAGGGSVKEVITRYQEGSFYELDLYDIEVPIKAGNARFSVTPINPNTTRVDVQFNFQPKFGPAGWVMAKLMMKPQFTKALNGMLKGLEDHVRTGKLIDQNGYLIDAEPVAA